MADPHHSLPGDMLFEQRNAFLDLLLGLVSLSERTVATVAELADAQSPEEPDPSRAPPPRSESILR